MIYFAHRGAPDLAPENTVESFVAAKKAGMTHFELDVQLSKDGQMVVHHDYSLSGTALVDAKIADLSYAELSALNVARHFKSGAFNCRIPRLEEVFEVLGKDDFVNIEVKNDGGIYPEIEKKVAEFVLSSGFESRVAVSSFYQASLVRLKLDYPAIKLGVLMHGYFDFDTALMLAGKLEAVSLNMSIKKVCPDYVAKIHAAGKQVLIYTVRTPEEERDMRAMGVDGVFINNPALARGGE